MDKRSLQMKARNALPHLVHFWGCLFLSQRLAVENFTKLTGMVSVMSDVLTWWFNHGRWKREVKMDLYKLNAKSAASFLYKKKKENADPILVCTVLWSTLIWQWQLRELFASVCHLKKTAATWRGAHDSWAVTATVDSKALALSLLKTLLFPLFLLLDLFIHLGTPIQLLVTANMLLLLISQSRGSNRKVVFFF